MASKSPLHKLQDTVVGTVKGAIAHPVGTAEKTVGQAKGAINLGRLVAEQVAKGAVGVVASRLPRHGGGAEAPEREPLRAVKTEEPETTEAPDAAEAPDVRAGAEQEPVRPPVSDVATESVKKKAAHQPVKKAAPAPESPIDAAADTAHVEATPVDVARTAAKKAPAKKTAAKKAPAKKAPAKKTAAKKTAAKKATTKKAAAKKATKTSTSSPSAQLPAKKAPTKKATTKSAAEVLEDTSVQTPVGTTGADVATNPDTTDHDLQQPGTAPLMDSSTTKSVASEQATLSAAADPEKG